MRLSSTPKALTLRAPHLVPSYPAKSALEDPIPSPILLFSSSRVGPFLSCSGSLDFSALDRENGMTSTAAIDEVLSVPRSDRYKNKDSEPSPAIYEPGPEPSFPSPWKPRREQIIQTHCRDPECTRFKDSITERRRGYSQ